MNNQSIQQIFIFNNHNLPLLSHPIIAVFACCLPLTDLLTCLLFPDCRVPFRRRRCIHHPLKIKHSSLSSPSSHQVQPPSFAFCAFSTHHLFWSQISLEREPASLFCIFGIVTRSRSPAPGTWHSEAVHTRDNKRILRASKNPNPGQDRTGVRISLQPVNRSRVAGLRAKSNLPNDLTTFCDLRPTRGKPQASAWGRRICHANLTPNR